MHDSRSCLLKVNSYFDIYTFKTKGLIYVFLECFSRCLLLSNVYLDLWFLAFTPGRCKWLKDAWNRPRGSGLLARATVWLQTLSQLLLPLPQTRGNRRTSHQPAWIGPCRDPPQVRNRFIHMYVQKTHL